MADLSVTYARDGHNGEVVLLWHTDDDGRRVLAGTAQRDDDELWRVVLVPLHDPDERIHLGWFTGRTDATLALLTSGDLIEARDRRV
jgi:hypothetical protein